MSGTKLLELLVDTKIMNSKSEARRAITNKGIKVNGIVIEDEKKILQLKLWPTSYMKTTVY